MKIRKIDALIHSRSPANQMSESNSCDIAQSADESWRECHLHARNLLGEHG